MRNKSEKIAVVTGGNRGIGFEICRQLARQKEIHVILTSRDSKKGEAACSALKNEGLKIDFYPLDVDDTKNISAFAARLEKDLGRCDILVNNAGIFPDILNHEDERFPSLFETTIETIERAMMTNVYGPILLCQTLIPIMRKNKYGRIVNISSGMGQLTDMNGGCPGYRISKTAINTVTRILSDELKNENIKINSMCPGWVKTEMGGPSATRSVEEGADTAIFLATLADSGPSGQFFRDRQVITW